LISPHPPRLAPAYHRAAMFARSPARFLAPLALAVVIVALVVIVSGSGGGGGSTTSTAGATGATKTHKAAKKKVRKPPKSYTVKPGDTLAQIALNSGITSDRLLILNPSLDPNALQVGQKIKLRP
jgi:LysM repeat protein